MPFPADKGSTQEQTTPSTASTTIDPLEATSTMQVLNCDNQVESFLMTKAPNNVLAKKKPKSIIKRIRFIYTPTATLL